MSTFAHYTNLHESLASGAHALDALQGTVLTAAGRSYVSRETEMTLEESMKELDELRISTRRTFNALRPLVRLPKDIIKYVARELVRVAQPQLRSRSTRRLGWLVILWLCHDIRDIVLDDPVVFALAYSQFPKQFKTMGTLCRGVGPLIIIDRVHPWTSDPRRNNGLNDTVLLKTLAPAYDWRAATSIHLENRGNVPGFVDHLLALSKVQPLNAMKDLSLWLASTNRHWTWFDKMNSTNFHDYLDVPALETAFFDGTWVPLISTVLRSLTLHWAMGGPYSAPSVQRLMHTLLEPHANTLRSLCLIDAIQPIEEVLLGGPTLPALTMLNLTRLELGGCAAKLLPVMLILPVTRVETLLLRYRTTYYHRDEDDIAQWSALRNLEQIGALIKRRPADYRAIRVECRRDNYNQHHILIRAWKMKPTRGVDLARDADLTIEVIACPSGPPLWHEAFLTLSPCLGLANVQDATFSLQCVKNQDHSDVSMAVWAEVFSTMPKLQRLTIDGVLADRGFVKDYLARALK